MPTTPTYCQSVGSPQTVTLKCGTTLTLRNGCLVNERTREVVTGSRDTTAYVLANCRLTDDERLHWQTWGNILCDRMNSQPAAGQCGSGLRRSNRVVEKMENAA